MSPRSGGPPDSHLTTDASREEAESRSRAVTRQPPQSPAERVRPMRSRRREEAATTPLMLERADWQFEEIGHALYEAAPSTTPEIAQEVTRQRAAMLTGGGCV
jgi:hypothetical protein